MEFRLPLRMSIKTKIHVQNVERDMTLMKVSFASVVIQVSHTQTGNHNLFHQRLYRPLIRHPNPQMPNWCKSMIFAFLYITIHNAKHGHTDPEWIFLYYKIPRNI